MPLGELREQCRKLPQLTVECEGLLRFLQKRAATPSQLFSPEQLAGQIHIDSELATALLMMADNAGLVRPKYVSYCPEHDVAIHVADRLSGVPEWIDCPYHGTRHRRDELRTELQFELRHPEELLTLEALATR